MAELRSFIIGVTIAGAVLLAGWLVFGGGGEGSTPTVRFIETPPATRTPAPAATRPPAPTSPPVSNTPSAGNTPATGQTQTPAATTGPQASPTLEVAPTQAPATATPEGDSVAAYTAAADPIVFGLQGQVNYLAGNTSSPALGDANWTSFTVQAAQNVQALAAQLTALSPPACLSAAHATLASAAAAASQGAGQAIAGAQANDAGQISAANASLNSAATLITQGISQGQGSSC